MAPSSPSPYVSEVGRWMCFAFQTPRKIQCGVCINQRTRSVRVSQVSVYVHLESRVVGRNSEIEKRVLKLALCNKMVELQAYRVELS